MKKILLSTFFAFGFFTLSAKAVFAETKKIEVKTEAKSGSKSNEKAENQSQKESDESNKADSDEPTRPTTLRPEGNVKVQWIGSKNGGYTNDIEVTLRNVGSVVAKNVSVSYKLAEGNSIPLSGPDSIEPNKRGTYAYAGATVSSKQPFNASLRVTCSNCRK